MEEGTIFQAQNNTSPQDNTTPVSTQSPSVIPPVAQPAVSPPISPSVPPQITPSPSANQPSPPPIDHGNGFFSRFNPKTLLKVLGAIILVVIALFIVFGLIIPHFNKPKNETVTLSYWGLWEDENVMKSVIAGFEKDNPKIKVKYTKQDPKDYRDKLNTRIASGIGPDIFRFHNSWYPMLSGVLLPLPKETIEKEEFSSQFYNVAQDDLIKNGAIYGIPLEIDTLALYVNPQIFDTAGQETGGSISVPTTWQEFIESSIKLTKRDENGKIDIAGAGIGTFENVTHAPDILSLLFLQNGVTSSNIITSNQKIAGALKFYTNFALTENNVWDKTLDNSLLAFSKGKLAMFFGYSWDYFTIKALNPDLSFKIYPVPQLLKDQSVNMASYWAEGVSSRSKNQKEALLFMKYLAKKETQEVLFTEQSKTRLFGEPYSNKNLAEKLGGTQVHVFVDQASTANSLPFADGTNDNGLNAKLNNYLKDSVNAILAGDSEDTATGTLLQGYSQVLGQYGASANH